MTTKLEIERKFLVKLPMEWSQLSEMFDDLVTIRRISQTYLTPEEGEQAARIRKTVEGLKDDLKTEYHFNQKKPVEAGVHEETEREISQADYNRYLKKADPKKHVVEKTRFVIRYNDQDFELDIFKGNLKGLAILELELEDKNDTIELPPFLKIVKEVTKDKKYTNFALADKKYHESED